jgi:hypothetical protein
MKNCLYLRECPDETVMLWTAEGQPVWTFASLSEALQGAVEWVNRDCTPSRIRGIAPHCLDSAA